MPVKRWMYPIDWEQRAREVKQAARWRCQRCGKQCRRPGEPFDTHKRTLTVAHVDHEPENDHARPTALCVPCHRRYDNKARTRRNTPGQMRILFLRGG